MNNKALSMLGLCNKAGKIIFGYDRVEKELLSGRFLFILTASDFSEKSTEKLSRLAKDKGMSIIKTDMTIDEFYYALSYRAGVLGIKDKGFANKLTELLQEELAL